MISKTKLSTHTSTPSLIFFMLLVSSQGWASSKTSLGKKPDAASSDRIQSSASAPVIPGSISSASADSVTTKKRESRFGMSYFAFINGPGLDPDLRDYPPNEIGRPDFTGINSFNVVSLKYKTSKKLAVDFQTRTRVVFNNGTDRDSFQNFIWEAPRIGVSGKLMAGKDWALTGAINSDFPSFLPSPLTGYTARERTILMNPGLFANFRYTPSGSRWSMFAVMTPRYFFYRDRDAIEAEGRAAGASGANKPELGLWMSPNLNYNLNDKSAITLGTGIGYVKQVGSSWNPTQATMVSNGSSSTAWTLEAIPLSVGYTHTFNESITVYPFIQAFPIAAQRFDAQRGTTASLTETASIGMWISGALF